jgi:hypothetical protein
MKRIRKIDNYRTADGRRSGSTRWTGQSSRPGARKRAGALPADPATAAAFLAAGGQSLSVGALGRRAASRARPHRHPRRPVEAAGALMDAAAIRNTAAKAALETALFDEVGRTSPAGRRAARRPRVRKHAGAMHARLGRSGAGSATAATLRVLISPACFTSLSDTTSAAAAEARVSISCTENMHSSATSGTEERAQPRILPYEPLESEPGPLADDP